MGIVLSSCANKKNVSEKEIVKENNVHVKEIKKPVLIEKGTNTINEENSVDHMNEIENKACDSCSSSSCLQDPGEESNLIQYISNRNDIFSSYILCFNFKITSNYSRFILDWSNKNMLGSNIQGISIIQGSSVYDSHEDYVEETPKRRLWLKAYDYYGNDYWNDCSYIPIGEHNINRLINITLFINDKGIMIYYNNEDDTIIKTESSGDNNTGFVFNDCKIRPTINTSFETTEIISLKLFAKN